MTNDKVLITLNFNSHWTQNDKIVLKSTMPLRFITKYNLQEVDEEIIERLNLWTAIFISN